MGDRGRFLSSYIAIFILPYLIFGAHRYRANQTSTFPAWAFPCRCSTSCDTETGACLDGGVCTGGLPKDYPWQDRNGLTGCKYGNVAYRKPATHSGTFYDFTPDKAVDGDTYPVMDHGSCAHPHLPRGQHAWWQVNLQLVYEISEIHLYNRAHEESAKRMSYFDIIITNTTSFENKDIVTTYSAPPVPGKGLQSFFYLTDPHYGRVVTYQRYGDKYDPNEAALCEVVIMGRTSFDCSGCPTNTPCNNLNGCQRCPDGAKLPECREGCDAEYYGENCENKCSSECRPGLANPCDAATGKCVDGCKQPADFVMDSWYVGDRCDIQVPRVQFGENDEVAGVSGLTGKSITLNWKESTAIDKMASLYIGYNVFISSNGYNFNSIKNVSYMATDNLWQETVITGLEPDTQYWVQIAAYRIYTDGKVYESRFKSGNITFSTGSEQTFPSSKKQTVVGLNSGLIVGTVVGVIGFLVMTSVVVVLVVKQRSNRNTSEEPSAEISPVPDSVKSMSQNVYEKPDFPVQYENSNVDGPYEELPAQETGEYEN